MLPGNDETDTIRPESAQRGHWNRPFHCSICTRFILFDPISLKEPIDVPEPRHEWVLCKACYEALLVEIRRSVIRSPVRLRIAMGLVAAERSPNAYIVNNKTREQREFNREFAWFVWAIVLFWLLHVIIFAILLAVPR
jgi:hypothetical protein